MSTYGVVRQAAAEIGTLCCGSTEEEVIHVKEILLADYVLPKLALMRLAHCTCEQWDGDHLVHFVGKQKLF